MSIHIVFAILVSSAQAGPIYGLARAGDGDSLYLGDHSIRLHGIDAPELDQPCTRDGKQWPCGAEAREQLSRLVTGRNIRCDPRGIDQHGRTLAQCYVDALDVNRTMVQRGYGVAFRSFSTEYVAAEEAAKAAKLGIWAGAFEMPADYRRGGVRADTGVSPKRSTRRPPARARSGSTASGGCVIKGNHSRRGEWIYHLPGMPYYDETRPEAIFCSEAQAQAAGYRRARVRQ